MPKLYDQNGRECQVTGLPPVFYHIEAADQRIAELERALEALVIAHHGYALGLGPCICVAHEDARRLLGMTRDDIPVRTAGSAQEGGR